VLVPRAAGSRVGAVHIAIDGQYKVPLGVQVYPRGADPSKAIDVSFTDINFAVPGDDNFRFTPPKGATVREQPMAMGGVGPRRARRLRLRSIRRSSEPAGPRSSRSVHPICCRA
jgi:hypothetical protein